jgi:carbamoyl-phosphate synthase small subunit
LPLLASNWRNEKSLSDYLIEHNVVAIAEIDTRKLTRLLRDKGAQNGCLVTGEKVNIETAKQKLREFSGLKGLDLAKEVTTPIAYKWVEDTWDLAKGHLKKTENLKTHIVAYDFGIKRNILRLLVNRGCHVTVVPATTPATEVFAFNPDGIFLSNGPGDPEPCTYAIRAIQEILETTQIPVFGICLGHQLLALASGAKTVKMKFGHHGANHPVQEVATKRVLISSQNHGFTVDEASLPKTLKVTHRSLFDGSLQGIARTDRPAFSFQGHPEASPGPQEVEVLFDQFMRLIKP